MTIIEKIHTMTDNIILKVTPDLITHFMTDLKPLASAGLGLYLLWLMIPLLLGNGQNTAEEVMKKIIVWMIVWVFAFNTGGWLTQANQAVTALYDWAAGSISIYSKLDASFDDVVDLSKTLYEKDDSHFVKIEGFAAEVIVLGSYYVFAGISIGYLVLSKMTLHLLILALPLTILAILFPMIKSMFAKWMHLFIENTLTVLFLNIVFKLVNTELAAFITKAAQISGTPKPGNLLSLGFDAAMTIIMMMLFVILSRIMASKLASAAMNSEAMSPITKLKK